MKTCLLSLLFFLILSVSFLATPQFPNGLFTLKELGLYFAVSIVSLINVAFVLFNKNKDPIRVTTLDLLSFIFLILIPLRQFMMAYISWPALMISVGTFILFYSVKVLSHNNDWASLVRKLMFTIIIVLIVNIVISGFQFFGLMRSYHSTSRISGMFFNPGPFSIFFASLFVVSLPAVVLLIRKKAAIVKVFLSIYILTCLFILFELNSRSSWIGLSFGLLVITCYYLIHYNKTFMNTYKYRIRLSAVSLLVCIPVLANWFYQIRPESASGRVLIWKSSYAMFNEHSLSGVGIDNFPGFYPFYQAKVLEDQTTNDRYGVFAGEIEYAFNDVLHTFAEVGIIGGMIYLWIILQSLYNINQFLKRNDPTDYRFITTTSLSAGIIVIVIAGMTAYPIQMLPIKLWFWLLIGVINAITTEQNNFKRVNLPNTVFYSNVLLLTSIAIFYSIFGFKKVNGYLLWQKNKKEMEAVEISEMAHFTPFMGNDAFYLKDLGFKYAEAGNNDIAELYFEKSISRKFSKDYYYILGKHYEKMGEYDKALFQYQLIESAIPHLIKPKYLQAMVYYELGNIELFEQVAEDLMLTDPKVYNLNVDQMKREIGFLRSRLHNKQD